MKRFTERPKAKDIMMSPRGFEYYTNEPRRHDISAASSTSIALVMPQLTARGAPLSARLRSGVAQRCCLVLRAKCGIHQSTFPWKMRGRIDGDATARLELETSCVPGGHSTTEPRKHDDTGLLFCYWSHVASAAASLCVD